MIKVPRYEVILSSPKQYNKDKTKNKQKQKNPLNNSNSNEIYQQVHSSAKYNRNSFRNSLPLSSPSLESGNLFYFGAGKLILTIIYFLFMFFPWSLMRKSQHFLKHISLGTNILILLYAPWKIGSTVQK